MIQAGPLASLDFGFRALTGPTSVQDGLTIANLSDAPRRYTLTPRFRRGGQAALALMGPQIRRR